jgi:hypothetical protein
MNLPTRNKNLTQPNLNVDQPRPDKKTKVSITIINPTHNPLPNKQVDQNMENSGEKKGRREEGNSTNKDTIEASEHFLTACPGSQECRDQ